jgi:hypothetical protein
MGPTAPTTAGLEGLSPQDIAPIDLRDRGASRARDGSWHVGRS